MITFDRIYRAYLDCVKRKQFTPSALEFSYGCLCENLQELVDDINNRTYTHSVSSVFVITYPTPREVYCAQFRDRVVQTFFKEEIENILDITLIENTASCRIGKGTSFALQVIKKQTKEITCSGTKEAYYLKIDLSGYFMSLNRELITQLMIDLINDKYVGLYKEELLYLAPIIYLNNPSINAIVKSPLRLWNLVPQRKRLKPNSIYGEAIGNVTTQYGSNLNLNSFDHYCIEQLGLTNYIRYVDDIIIQHKDKNYLYYCLPLIENKLLETGQIINKNKTIIDTCYHGVKFLGKITYPYGYQKFTKETKARTIKQAREIIYDENLLSRLNSCIGRFYYYASYNLLQDYLNELPKEVWNYVTYNQIKMKFEKGINYGYLRNNY